MCKGARDCHLFLHIPEVIIIPTVWTSVWITKWPSYTTTLPTPTGTLSQIPWEKLLIRLQNSSNHHIIGGYNHRYAQLIGEYIPSNVTSRAANCLGTLHTTFSAAFLKSFQIWASSSNLLGWRFEFTQNCLAILIVVIIKDPKNCPPFCLKSWIFHTSRVRVRVLGITSRVVWWLLLCDFSV